MSNITFKVASVDSDEQGNKIAILAPSEGGLLWSESLTVTIPLDHPLYDEIVQDYEGRFVGPRPPKPPGA